MTISFVNIHHEIGLKNCNLVKKDYFLYNTV